MTIRPAGEKDLKDCARLARKPALAIPSGGYMKVQWLKSWLDPDFFLLMENKNEIIGYTYGEQTKGGGFLISHLVVDKDYRGKGIGTKLIKELEKRAKKRGSSWIFLYGPTFDEQTIKFYEKRGYNKGKSYYEYGKEL